MKDRIKERAKKREGHNRGSSMFSLPEDMEFLEIGKKMRLDFVPYRVSVDTHPEAKKGEMWYERTFFTHRGIGPEQISVICPSTIGKKCPICEEYNKLRKDPDADEDVVRALRRSEREAFNVIDADEPKKGVQLLTISTAMFGDKLEEEIREGNDDLASFPFLKGGKTLAVRFHEKSLGKSKFWECSKIEFEDRDDMDDDVLDEVADLDKIMNIMSYDELEKLFLQTGDEDEEEEDGTGDVEDDEDSDEDKKVHSKKHQKSKVKKAKDDDEDEGDDNGDEESDSEDEDSDEDESDSDDADEDDDEDTDGDDDDSDDDSDEDDTDDKPSKKSKKSSDDDDEDDEDGDGDEEDEDEDDDVEDGDEDEEDEKPRRRSK